MTPLFTGTGVAIITPFKADLSIDFNALERLINHTINNGVNYIVLLGTTGESVTLTEAEKKELIKFTVEKVNNRVPLVLGIGGNNTNTVLESFDKYDLSGFKAILSVSPYYNKPTQEGIYQHYKAIAQKSPLPIILYNVPGRTGSNILPQTTLRLANDFDNIIAIKEASGNVEQIMHIIQHKPKDFLVISGDDALTLPLIAAGASGVISVLANVYPKAFSQMVQLALNNDYAAARKIHYQYLETINLLFKEGNPAGAKAFLANLNITEPFVRLPLVNVSPATNEAIKQEIAKLK